MVLPKTELARPILRQLLLSTVICVLLLILLGCGVLGSTDQRLCTGSISELLTNPETLEVPEFTRIRLKDEFTEALRQNGRLEAEGRCFSLIIDEDCSQSARRQRSAYYKNLISYGKSEELYFARVRAETSVGNRATGYYLCGVDGNRAKAIRIDKQWVINSLPRYF